MSQSQPDVLILDDGELDDLVLLAGELQLNYQRLRGGGITEDHEPPLSLLVTTPRRADAVRPGDAPGAATGRPLRIISSSEDSTPMRAMLRRQGFDLLVRRPTHREIWRLLIQRALYQGDERRRDLRVPVGSEVDLGSGTKSALLVDVSNRGGHLLSNAQIEVGSSIALTLPASCAEGEALELRGEVVRSVGSGQRYSIGLLFDRDLPESTRQRLGSLLNSWIRGGESLAESDAVDRRTPLPSCESPAIPGLTLDEETDPAVLAHVEVGLHVPGGDSSKSADRRRHQRSPFMQTIEATADSGRVVLIGRNLSAGGMRIEPLGDLGVGDLFDIAIYRPDRPEPIRVTSEVVRDDGDLGLALTFLDIEPEVAADLEKLVACLPDVEPLQAGETSGLGTVIAEIVSVFEDA